MIPKRFGVNKTSTKSYKSQKESPLTSDTLEKKEKVCLVSDIKIVTISH